MISTSAEVASIVKPDSANVSEFGQSIEAHLPAMRRLAARLGPPAAHDDIVQEALIRAWRNWLRFDPARGTLGAWLFAIVANEARRKWGIRRFLAPVAPQSNVASRDDALDIHAAVVGLPGRQKLAVDCFYFAGLSVDETAAVMKCSPGTVKALLSQARAHLRSTLEDGHEYR